MRKIIIIGESALQISLDGNRPIEAFPCGTLLRAAALLGRAGHAVTFVSEAATEPVGDIIVRYLADAGVDIHSVDRFTDGTTPLRLAMADGRAVRYGTYGEATFTVVWPRIDPDDILLFGGNYALEPRCRQRLFDMVRHGRERRATIVYVPDFDPTPVRNITHLMPAILESFEAADIAVTTAADHRAIFNDPDAATAFRNHISFYTNAMLDLSDGRVSAYCLPDVQPLPPIVMPDDHEPTAPAMLAALVEALLALPTEETT